MSLLVISDAPFSLAHIIYLIINLIWFILGSVLIKKYVKNQKTLELIIRISGLLLLICVSTMRIGETIHFMNKEPGIYHWYSVLPNSFCSFASFFLGIFSIFYKKDNIVFHFLIYIALIGGLIATVFPEYLGEDGFFSLVGITALLHHSLSIWICIILLVNKQITPEYKKIFAFIIGFGIMLLLGAFELFVLKYPTSMNLDKPLSRAAGIISSWYFIYLGSTLLTLLFIFILRKIYKLPNKDEIKPLE